MRPIKILNPKHLPRPAPPRYRRVHTWLFLTGFGQVGDAGVRTHQHVAGVQRPLQEQLLGLRQVDATQGSLGQSVGRHQSQTIHAHLVNTVYRLERSTREPLYLLVKLQIFSLDHVRRLNGLTFITLC